MRRMTGVRYFSAMRAASNAASKQWLGDRGATIGSGASPWRPYIASSRSDCSVFVGSPVDGPAALHVDDEERQLEADREAHRSRTSGRCPGRWSR